MLTIDNYFDEISHIDISALPETLQQGHAFMAEATDNGTNWQPYQDGPEIKEAIDLYLSKLNERLDKEKAPSVPPSKNKPNLPERPAPPPKSAPSPKPKKEASPTPTTPPVNQVERIPEEFRFIRRYINLGGKSKTKEEILRFINALQKAILEKRIRKTSDYADAIRHIQDRLIKIYNTMKARARFELEADVFDEFKGYLGEQKVLASINFIKRYIGMNGKPGMKEKAAKLLDQINRAIDKGKILDNDPYIGKIHSIKGHLKKFTTGKAQKVLEIEKTTLNGLNGLLGALNPHKQGPFYNTKQKKLDAVRTKGNIITFKDKFYPKGKANPGHRQIIVQRLQKEKAGCKIIGEFYNSDWYDSLDDLLDAVDWQLMEDRRSSMQGLGAIDEDEAFPVTKDTIMNSVDFAKLEFQTLGFKGKWLNLIGDPSPGFTAMVFGKPKMGKSYLCMEFAGYLARNHGKVLYVAKEEGLDMTLQKKLTDKNVAHPGLFVASTLPDYLSVYDFIFLDSVNKMGLSPDDLTDLKSSNPGKSFIFIFQTTKDGNFRGTNAFQHDVDAVIELPEKGVVIQNGRFNQGGSVNLDL